MGSKKQVFITEDGSLITFRYIQEGRKWKCIAFSREKGNGTMKKYISISENKYKALRNILKSCDISNISKKIKKHRGNSRYLKQYDFYNEYEESILLNSEDDVEVVEEINISELECPFFNVSENDDVIFAEEETNKDYDNWRNIKLYDCFSSSHLLENENDEEEHRELKKELEFQNLVNREWIVCDS